MELTYIDPRCDRSKWPAGEWDGEPDKVQWKDAATGFQCLAKRHPSSGHWCGYVGVAPGHPWHGKDWSDSLDIEVHGGITYGDHCAEGPPEHAICHIPEPGEPEHLWWLGFDCAHSGDRSPQDEVYAIEKGYPFTRQQGERYRPLSYVRAECTRLAQQAAAAA